MSSVRCKPRRGEVWRIDFDPTVGTEIRKTRPAVVLSSDSIGRLPIKLVAPVTTWQEAFAGNLWHVRIEPDSRNGLARTSAVDTLQIRGVGLTRFVDCLGVLPAETVDQISAALAAVVELEPEVTNSSTQAPSDASYDAGSRL